jgi:hypothetical protein
MGTIRYGSLNDLDHRAALGEGLPGHHSWTRNSAWRFSFNSASPPHCLTGITAQSTSFGKRDRSSNWWAYPKIGVAIGEKARTTSANNTVGCTTGLATGNSAFHIAGADLWLVDQTSASWNQLIQWLRQIGVIQTVVLQSARCGQ